MSREQYTPPTLTQQQPSTSQQQQQQQQTTTTTTGGSFNLTGASLEDTSRPVNYLCGDCDSKVVLRRNDPIRCKECGYRVLYKERTNSLRRGEKRGWLEAYGKVTRLCDDEVDACEIAFAMCESARERAIGHAWSTDYWEQNCGTFTSTAHNRSYFLAREPTASA